MRLLLLGGSGQVGSEFRALDRPKDVVVVAPGLDELDLTKPGAIANAIAAGRGTPLSTLPLIPRWIGPRASGILPSRSTQRRRTTRNRNRAARHSADPHLDRLCVRRPQGRALCRDRCHAPLNVYGPASWPASRPSPLRTRVTSSCAHHGSTARTAKFRQDDFAPGRRARAPDHCRRSARLPDRRE